LVHDTLFGSCLTPFFARGVVAADYRLLFSWLHRASEGAVMMREWSVVEQRYRAVLEVLDGAR
jgi:hypothetical protein